MGDEKNKKPDESSQTQSSQPQKEKPKPDPELIDISTRGLTPDPDLKDFTTFDENVKKSKDIDE